MTLPRPKPPSVMDDLGAVGDRLREIRRQEDRQPADPLAEKTERDGDIQQDFAG